jgi:hypothetical protein
MASLSSTRVPTMRASGGSHQPLQPRQKGYHAWMLLQQEFRSPDDWQWLLVCAQLPGLLGLWPSLCALRRRQCPRRRSAPSVAHWCVQLQRVHISFAKLQMTEQHSCLPAGQDSAPRVILVQPGRQGRLSGPGGGKSWIWAQCSSLQLSSRDTTRSSHTLNCRVASATQWWSASRTKTMLVSQQTTTPWMRSRRSSKSARTSR